MPKMLTSRSVEEKGDNSIYRYYENIVEVEGVEDVCVT